MTNDHFLEQLIDLMPYEKAPDNFTNGIMLQLSAGVQPIADTPESRRQLLWGYVTLAVAFAGVVLMLFARWPFLNFDLTLSTDLIRTVFTKSINLFNSLTEMMSYLKSSSVTILIFASVGILLLLERILRKGLNRNQTIIL
ncbi:MAG: hypothetical protein RBR28_06195 [Lentimicrobium sp.]|nr:hypothetical protein [Lentimicrobium sp.]